MIDFVVCQRLTSDEVEAKLRDVLLVLKYVQNKDVFMRYHKVSQSQRMISNIWYSTRTVGTVPVIIGTCTGYLLFSL